MSATHSVGARNAATDAVLARLGNGAKLKFRISPSTIAAPGAVAATLSFPAASAAFGASANGTATANAIASDTNAAGNAAAVAYASMETSAGVIEVHCAVAAASSDINMSNGLVVAAGDTVSCSSLTYTALNA